jgi:hypothetical protein
MGKDEIKEMIEDWRGRGTVTFSKMDKLPNGKYQLQFKEPKKPRQTIEVESLGEADAIRQEFGGKNEETYAAKPELLKLFKGFGSFVGNTDHEILLMNIEGSRKSIPDHSRVEIPEGCGTKTTLKGSKVAVNERMIKKTCLLRISTEVFTMQFSSNAEVDKLVDSLFGAEEFKVFDWYVHNIVTLNRELKVPCKWVRKKAGDGSKTMELQLHYLDGKFYQDCLVYDLTAAADELIYKECRLINLKKQEPTAWICADALEQGKIDKKGKATKPKGKKRSK